MEAQIINNVILLPNKKFYVTALDGKDGRGSKCEWIGHFVFSSSETVLKKLPGEFYSLPLSLLEHFRYE